MTKAQVDGQGAQQRRVFRSPAASRTGKGDQQGMQPLALGAPAEDVEPVADLQFLKLAQKPVEFAQRNGRFLADGDAAIAIEPGGAGLFEDRRRKHPDTPPIAKGGLVIFVDQPLQLRKETVTAGAGQRRRQMVDDDRLSPPLCLRALARIVDDERVEVRQRR